MMEPGVYIANLKMIARPLNKKSRLLDVIVNKERYPITLDSSGNIPEDIKKMICKNLLGKRSVHYDKYRVRVEYSNAKFSTKIYGT